MARTILTTPVVNSCCRAIAIVLVKILGWRMAEPGPQVRKAILTGAPHTSNWDFMYMLLAILIWRLDMRWIGKHTLFKGPMGPIMRWLGGIPIDRTSSVNFVDQMIARFNQSEELMVVIAPEGTRAPAERWRSGFYHMAYGANVPIVLTYIDYQKKEIGIMAVETPSGDADSEIARYQAMFKHKPGKHPYNYYGYEPLHDNKK